VSWIKTATTPRETVSVSDNPSLSLDKLTENEQNPLTLSLSKGWDLTSLELSNRRYVKAMVQHVERTVPEIAN